MITAIQEGMARFNRLGLEASTALKTSMVWRAAHNIREEEERRRAARKPFLSGMTFRREDGTSIDPSRIYLDLAPEAAERAIANAFRGTDRDLIYAL